MISVCLWGACGEARQEADDQAAGLRTREWRWGGRCLGPKPASGGRVDGPASSSQHLLDKCRCGQEAAWLSLHRKQKITHL